MKVKCRVIMWAVKWNTDVVDLWYFWNRSEATREAKRLSRDHDVKATTVVRIKVSQDLVQQIK